MRVLFTWLLPCLMACTSQPAPIPDGVLPPDRFQAVLLEAQLVEARMNHELVVTRESIIPGADYYDEMFKEFAISRDDFERSFAYYSRQPEVMARMYEEIIAELVRRKDEGPQ